jgi:hypothetical protein
MKQLLGATICLMSLVLLSTALAAEGTDPTGTWKWTVMFNNQSRDVTLKLKLEDGKLTGSMPGRNNQEVAIEDGKFENGKVSFKVTRERNGQKMTTVYNGEVKGDSLKGTTEFERNGEKRSRPWEATRQK